VHLSDTTSSSLTELVVTQIPLDNPAIPQELTVSSTRPPWIRPARKKNRSASRSTAGVDSTSQDTSEFVVSPITTAQVNTAFSLVRCFSPDAPNQTPRRFSAGTDATREQFLDPLERSEGDRLELQEHDAGVGTMPILFGDGHLDVTGLFSTGIMGYP
jgi:hypothetical protein